MEKLKSYLAYQIYTYEDAILKIKAMMKKLLRFRSKRA